MEIDAGMTVYEWLKNEIKQGEKPMSKFKVRDTLSEIVRPFLANAPQMTHETVYDYFMLLCNERKDYTVFRMIGAKDTIDNTLAEMYTCLMNRGNPYVIKHHDMNNGIEIWMEIDGEIYCYYFFPYNIGVIEC